MIAGLPVRIPPKIRQWLYAALVIGTAAGLAFLLRRVVASLILEPAAYMLWGASLYYRLIPQTVHWAVLLMVILSLMYASLRTRPARRPKSRLLEAERETRLETWLSWIGARDQGSYSRWRLANRLADLTVEALAQEQHISTQAARRSVENGELDLPPEIAAYLIAGLGRQELEPLAHSFWPWRIRKPDPRLSMDPQKLLDYLEEHRQR